MVYASTCITVHDHDGYPIRRRGALREDRAPSVKPTISERLDVLDSHPSRRSGIFRFRHLGAYPFDLVPPSSRSPLPVSCAHLSHFRVLRTHISIFDTLSRSMCLMDRCTSPIADTLKTRVQSSPGVVAGQRWTTPGADANDGRAGAIPVLCGLRSSCSG